MTVQVTIPNPQAGAAATSTKDHADADKIDMHDGHLFVQKAASTGGKSVAIYPPGRWISAEVSGGKE